MKLFYTKKQVSELLKENYKQNFEKHEKEIQGILNINAMQIKRIENYHREETKILNNELKKSDDEISLLKEKTRLQSSSIGGLKTSNKLKSSKIKKLEDKLKDSKIQLEKNRTKINNLEKENQKIVIENKELISENKKLTNEKQNLIEENKNLKKKLEFKENPVTLKQLTDYKLYRKSRKKEESNE